jgi:hypothetical protein
MQYGRINSGFVVPEKKTAENAILMLKSSERAGTYHMYARTTFSYASMFWFKFAYYIYFGGLGALMQGLTFREF